MARNCVLAAFLDMQWTVPGQIPKSACSQSTMEINYKQTITNPQRFRIYVNIYGYRDTAVFQNLSLRICITKT